MNFYPAQTSFIPIQISLARFLESQGIKAFFENYPYWYLGSTPYRWLTGPIIPSILVLLKKLFPAFSFFEIFFMLLVFFLAIGAMGVYLLIRELSGTKRTALFTAFFYLFGPFIPLLFPFSDGLSLIAFSFMPFSFLSFIKFLECKKGLWFWISAFWIVFITLLDVTAVPNLILGLVVVLLSKTEWKYFEENIKKLLKILGSALLISTLWYGPKFWIQILFSSSFAGKPFYSVIDLLAKLMPSVLAFILGILGSNILKTKKTINKFIFYWLFIFGFLTFLRFISDPDFWLDWSAYSIEIQFGLAMVLGIFIGQKILGSTVLGLIYFLIFIFIFNKNVLGSLQFNIDKTVEYKIGNFLSGKMQGGDKVFLSGTTAFWFNAFFDKVQVRGGRDPVESLNGFNELVWEIREGEDPGKSINLLNKYGINYLVIHTSESKEYYHDFSRPDKFENNPSLEKIYDENGDKIYKLNVL